jgi:hypothetical protein
MADRRTPPKQRHRDRPRKASGRPTPPAQPSSPDAYSAPSHLGGQFEQHDYGHGHGGFGFTQHLLP